MSEFHEVSPQLYIIKNFPIEDGTANLVRVEKWLMRSCRQINNRKAPMGKANCEGEMMVRIQ